MFWLIGTYLCFFLVGLGESLMFSQLVFTLLKRNKCKCDSGFLVLGGESVMEKHSYSTWGFFTSNSQQISQTIASDLPIDGFAVRSQMWICERSQHTNLRSPFRLCKFAKGSICRSDSLGSNRTLRPENEGKKSVEKKNPPALVTWTWILLQMRKRSHTFLQRS